MVDDLESLGGYTNGFYFLSGDSNILLEVGFGIYMGLLEGIMLTLGCY